MDNMDARTQNQVIEEEAQHFNPENIKEEFYKWFENRGLLSDLRAYMRQLMVKALEESNRNGKTTRQRKTSTSPKLQAINLLVVDYLFHEDYLYTVSVFASEAQILDSLPQYSCYITETVRENRWDRSSLPRFTQQEAEDILDTLRLPPSQREARRAAQLYLSGQESLLTCVVRTMTSSHSISSNRLEQIRTSLDVEEDNEQEHMDYNHQLWSQEMQDLLLLAGVKLQHIKRMQHKWAQTLEEEKFKAKKEAEVELLRQQSEWQQTMEERLKGEMVDQMQAEQQLLRERQSRVELRERGLTSLAEQLTAVHDDINQRLAQLQLQSDELHVREARQESEKNVLEEKLNQLLEREKQVDHMISSVQEQTVAVTCREIEGNEILVLNTELRSSNTIVTTQEASVQVVPEENKSVTVFTQTADPVVAVCTQTINTVDHEQQTSLDNHQDPQLIHQIQMDREKINELQEENLELRAHALQQRHRIDELTNRAATLSSQLEESQIAVSVLSGRESAVVATPQAPPPTNPPPMFIAPTFGFNSPQRIGAGEESLFTPRPQQTTPRPDGRRRPSRFAFSHNPAPNSEESSPTDEVIQNARTRIQQLEEESAAVQRNYQQFQARLMTSDSVMFPPLGSSLRIHDPVMRVRRSDIVPVVPLAHVPYPPHISLNNYRSRYRRTEPRDEEIGDSSSDQATFYGAERLDSVTNSRRMFTNRNIRHFERWKQFKKKFQRRDTLDHSRRNLHVPYSNTSSEDDEGDFRNTRRRHETNLLTRAPEIHNTTQVQQQIGDSLTKIKEDSKLVENQVDSQTALSASNRNCKANLESNYLPAVSFIFPHTERALNIETKTASSKIEQTSEQLKLGSKRSKELIESVKSLLSSQNVKPPNSTLSNESLAVESLPRDSQDGSNTEIAQTESNSVLTVQTMNPGFQNETKNKIFSSTTQDQPKGSQPGSDFIAKKYVASEHPNNELECELEDERVFELQENNPIPLTIPTETLITTGLNMASEDLIEAAAVASRDEAEQENGDRGTTSVTSGSDILRELNPSKTESSDSVISTGWAHGSKHSSDFWD